MTDDEKKKRIYQAETLGVPPLKMVLVHADNERANRTRRPLPKRRPKSKDQQQMQELIIRLIQSLEQE
jgi:hypothetical protein